MNRFSSTRPEVPGLLPSGSRSPHGQSRSGVAAKEGDQRPEPIPSFHWSNFFFFKAFRLGPCHSMGHDDICSIVLESLDHNPGMKKGRVKEEICPSFFFFF